MKRRWIVSPEYRLAIDAIRATREAQGLSQREVARRLGLPPSFPNKVENLERRLDILEFIAFARVLDLDPHLLLDKILDVLPEAFTL